MWHTKRSGSARWSLKSSARSKNNRNFVCSKKTGGEWALASARCYTEAKKTKYKQNCRQRQSQDLFSRKEGNALHKRIKAWNSWLMRVGRRSRHQHTSTPKSSTSAAELCIQG